MGSSTIWTIGSILLVSISSFVGVFLLSLSERILKKILLSLVSFAAGALLGSAFLHLLPEIVEQSANVRLPFILVLVGMLLSFLIERFLHFHHCHQLECSDHVHPAGTVMLIGDSVHNLLDGILIATSYLVSVPVGIATTVAVLLHEIPQEIGDFAILLHSGYTKRRALFLNFLSALTAFIGAVLVLFLDQGVAHLEAYLLPIAVGNFIYIAESDLLPELKKESNIRQASFHFFWMFVGVGLMWVLTFVGV